MIKSLVNAIKEQAEHIGGIKSFKYEGADLINAQNNNNTIQVWVEDDIYSEYIVTKDLLKVQLNIDILDKVYQGDDKLEVHNTTLKIAIGILEPERAISPVATAMMSVNTAIKTNGRNVIIFTLIRLLRYVQYTI